WVSGLGEQTRHVRAARLTRRERQVVNLFLEGCENIDIARQLGIAHRTVKACFNRLYLRFGITQRHQTGQACRASLPQPAMFSGNAGGATSKRLRTARLPTRAKEPVKSSFLPNKIAKLVTQRS